MKKPVMFNEKVMSFQRIVVYFVGLFIMCLGIAFAVNSKFGVSPVTTLPYVTGRILNISVGTGTMVAYVLYILIEWAIYGKKFKVIYILQFPAALVFGVFTDFCKRMISPLGYPIGNWPIQLLFIVVGIVLLGFGLCAYLTSDIMAIPPDALAVCLAWKLKKPLYKCKRGFDLTVTALSLCLSLIFMHDYDGLWIGTILAALGVGQMLKFWTPLIQPTIKKWLYGEQTNENAKVLEKAE